MQQENEDACGIYIITNHKTSGDVYEYARELYVQYDLGYGETKDGVLLYLSMSEREYALLTFGQYANSVFPHYVLDAVSETFLDDFASDDWYSGFSDYIITCREYLVSGPAAAPSPDYEYNYNDTYYDYTVYDPGPGAGAVAAVIIIPLAAALIFCLVIKRRMNTARASNEAGGYVIQNGVDIRVRQDIFTHSTRHVQQINSGSGGGGGGRSFGAGGGFSGKSGRF